MGFNKCFKLEGLMFYGECPECVRQDQMARLIHEATWPYRNHIDMLMRRIRESEACLRNCKCDNSELLNGGER